MSAKKKEAEETEAPAAEGEAAEGAPKKGKKKLLFIVGGVLALVLVGVGLFLGGVIGGKKDAAPEGEAAATGEPGKEGEKGEGKPAEAAAKPVYYELPQFLVNLHTSSARASFLKMSVTLELRDQAAVATMDASKPRIQDVFNTYLRELRASDIQGSAGIYRLRTELVARLNSTIEDGIVKDILFSEIVVQ